MTDDQRRRASEMAKLRRKRRLLNLALVGLGAQSGMSPISPLSDVSYGDMMSSPGLGLHGSSGLDSSGVGLLSPNSGGSGRDGKGDQTDMLLPPGLVIQPGMESLLKERQREFWREEKRKYRARMSDQKRKQVRQHDAHYKRSRRQLMKDASDNWSEDMEHPDSEGMFIKQEPVWMYEEDETDYSYSEYREQERVGSSSQDPGYGEPGEEWSDSQDQEYEGSRRLRPGYRHPRVPKEEEEGSDSCGQQEEESMPSNQGKTVAEREEVDVERVDVETETEPDDEEPGTEEMEPSTDEW